MHGIPFPLRVAGLVVFAAAALALVAGSAHAQTALVNDGTLGVGVQTLGQLSAPGAAGTNCAGSGAYSIRYMPTNDEGMDCDTEGEGWGVAYDSGLPTATAGWASSGVLTPMPFSFPPPATVSFTASASAATTVARVGDILVTQDYHPNAVYPQAYEDHIQLTNVGTTAHNNLLYRRAMSWGSAGCHNDSTYETIDVPPGMTVPGVVKRVGMANGAISTLNPTVAPVGSGGVPVVYGPPTAAPMIHWSGGDVAAFWDFDFGTFYPGTSADFTLYYGADATVSAAQATVVGLGVQEYNLAEAGDVLLIASCGGAVVTEASPVTFFMAFGGLSYPAPIVSIAASPPPPACSVAAVHFDGLQEPPSATAVWAWDFGDGTAGSGPSVDHAYLAAGTYVVTATVTDPSAATATAATTVAVPDPSPCPPSIDPMAWPLMHPGDTIVICPVGHAGNGGSLSYTAVGQPYNAVIDASGCLTWTPTDNQVGSYQCIRFTVTETPNIPNVVPENSGLSASTCLYLRVADDHTIIDSDLDSIADTSDNCPATPNHEQADSDHDGLGDACDGTPCPPGQLWNAVSGQDDGGECIAGGGAVTRMTRLTTDTDSDGVADFADNCPTVANAQQDDLDHDEVGDVCDADMDGDGISNVGTTGTFVDNCPTTPNEDQADHNDDGVGDACQTAAATVPTTPGRAAPDVALTKAPSTGSLLWPMAAAALGAALGSVALVVLARRRR